jgi:hypothetical protein
LLTSLGRMTVLLEPEEDSQSALHYSLDVKF